jgi:uncharacterized protein YndB with AHSA1/START domain
MLHEAPTSTPARLVLEGTIPAASPTAIIAHFTDPRLLATWWPTEAEVADDGHYVYRWPAQEWTLRGRFLEVVPGHRVHFTWAWDHEPLATTKSVLVTASEHPDGSRITITHGDYGPDAAGERHDHAEGWQYFAGKLAARFG